ncbi:MAG: helix-turn-helix domain-containing protein [Saprospiraceae bacterium]
MEKEITTEEKIIQAAKSAFLEHGMAGARMQDIADRAGINKALLHYYFRSKEKLFEIIFKEAFFKLVPQLNEILSHDDDFFIIIRKV